MTGTSKMAHVNLQFVKLHADIPFLSGQIFAKSFISSDGRLPSIGMQYLKSTLVNSQPQTHKETNHMTCNLSFSRFSCDFRRTKSCTICSSALPPDSSPRES